jgi:hypothetical protein
MKNTISIANGAGFWGDRAAVPVRLIENGGFDYLTLEYLAELTMSILAAQKKADPLMGYVKDFPDLIKKVCKSLQKKKIKIVTNAGGLNPIACAKAVAKNLVDGGLRDLKVGVVFGDNILEKLPQLISKNLLKHMDTNQSIKSIASKIISANVYFGADGIVKCLQEGADIVITGRVADASLTLGPCIHEFNWDTQNNDLMAAGMIAGHLIECGAQVTGGNYSGKKDFTLKSPGYPIAKINADGTFVITKEKKTDGRVSIGTVSEQLIYEIGDPKNYFTPDVICDFTSVQLQQKGKDEVLVSHCNGKKATNTLKVSIAYDDGYKCTNTLLLYGIHAYEKAKECFEIIEHQIKKEKIKLKDLLPEYLGSGNTLPIPTNKLNDSKEIFLRISAAADNKEDLIKFSKLFAPLVTSGPAGVSGYTGGSPKPQKLLGFWPALLEKKLVTVETEVKKAGDFI